MTHSREFIDGLCDEYEALWHRDHQFSIEQFLSAKSLPLEGELVHELIVQDIDLRFSVGMPIHQGTYEERFPNHSKSIVYAFRRIDSCEVDEGDASTIFHSQDGTGPSMVDVSKLPNQLGQYEIMEPLGKGGFGFVFRGRHQETQQDYALKFPKNSILDSLEEYQQFRFESEAAQQLNHPAIVKSYGLHEEDGFTFIVQQLVKGTNLQEAKKEYTDPEKAVKLISTLAEAIAYAHRLDLVHRDLKPSNVLIQENGTPLIADFGLTVHESFQRRLKGQRCGTAAYMSPEQVMGLTHQLDGRSDVWSLGVMLYELLAERRPFSGPSDEDVFEEIKNRNERPLRMLRPNLDNELQRICLKCLSKPIRDRYCSADELADDLNNWLRHSGQWQTHAYAPLVPRGLASFGADDAEAFVELLPGTRNRHGLPQSIEQWKSKLESVDGNDTFRVGVIFGPSGSGKSSFVKAGLIPNLNTKLVTPIYVESTGRDTEVRILKSFRNRWDSIPDSVSLPELLDGIRNNIWANDAHRIVILLDQFEQWLQGTSKVEAAQLVQALRHCDGNRLCCVLMVRDEYWLSTSRLTEALGVDFQEHKNASRLDRFEREHATKVLFMIGRALDKLPQSQTELSKQQFDFLEQVVNDLSEEGRVISVHLTLFAEMFKHRDWTLKELTSVGGVFAVGTQYLEQIFDSENSPRELRDIKPEVKLVLEALLPEAGNNLKGHMKPYRVLRNVVSEKCDSTRFNRVLTVLSDELRIISDTTPDHARNDTPNPSEGERHYQLTHDYLVPAIRNWLAREKQTTWRGRAQLKLDELSKMWKSGKQDRFLPTFLDHLKISWAVPANKRTDNQKQFLSSSNRLHGVRIGLILLTLLLAGWTYLQFQSNRRKERAFVMARDYITEPAQVAPRILEDLKPYQKLLTEEFRKNLSHESPSVRLRSRIALMKSDPETAMDADGILYDLSELENDIELQFFLDQLVQSQFDLRPVLEEMAQALESNPDPEKEISLAFLSTYTGNLEYIPPHIIDIHRTRESINDPPSLAHQYPTAATELIYRFKKLLDLSNQARDQEELANRLHTYCLEQREKIDVFFHLLVMASDLDSDSFSQETFTKWESLVRREYELNPDSGIHEMCRFLASRYGIDLSALTHKLASLAPSKDRDWWVVRFPESICITFVRIRVGEFTRHEGVLAKNFDQTFLFPEETVRSEQEFWLASTEYTVASLQPWLAYERSLLAPYLDEQFRLHYLNRPKMNALNITNLEGVHYAFLHLACLHSIAIEKNLRGPAVAVQRFDPIQITRHRAWLTPRLEISNSYELDLPTCDQWELAARAGSRTLFPWGDHQSLDVMNRYARFTISPFEDYNAAYAPPGTRIPNRSGLFDLISNVEETCKLSLRDAQAIKELEELRGKPQGIDTFAKGCGIIPGTWHSTSYVFPCSNTFSTAGVRWKIRIRQHHETTNDASVKLTEAPLE